ncbi:hypothetical protein BV22DRAFT_767609 [Leucogyrophana mollusca]|uniref:Uncharacterized protein n=1 Tax=Leucogyrophana mollusca TaxID=85980 RepID=A0ACB8B6L3_9AGAM|nr:hypothetical protein BV22DRAFT_767609 [Leucogyrophana mollusca]
MSFLPVVSMFFLRNGDLLYYCLALGPRCPCHLHYLYSSSPGGQKHGLNHKSHLLDAFNIPPVGTDFQPDAVGLSHHGQYHSKPYGASLLHDSAVDRWLGESRILLFLEVFDIALGAYSGVARLSRLDDAFPGMIICGMRKLFPHSLNPKRRI